MGKILAQLEQMASLSSGGSSLGSSVEEFFSDTPSTVTDNIPIKAEAAGIADFGLSQAEMDEFGSGGITTDIGEEHDITISGGKQAGYKDLLDKIKKEDSKGGSGDGPVPVKPIQGRLPGLIGSQGSVNYRPVQEPYQYGVPSVLNSQAEIQNRVINDLTSALGKTILKRPNINFRGLLG